LKREKKPTIKFPPSSDPKWKEVDAELAVSIPIVFTKNKMKQMSVSELSIKFLDWIHAFFA
jgi:hypothetical protein